MKTKQNRNYCSDPFQLHKAKRLRGVQVVSAALISAVNDERIGKKTYLCVSCRKRLTKDPHSLPDISENEESDSPLLVSSSSSQVESQDEARPEVDMEDTGQALQVLDQTPLRSGTFSVFTGVQHSQ